jgi:uncharacterized protein YceK
MKSRKRFDICMKIIIVIMVTLISGCSGLSYSVNGGYYPVRYPKQIYVERPQSAISLGDFVLEQD